MMGKGQRIVTTILWGLAVLSMLGLVGTGLWAKRAHNARLLASEQAALASARQERVALQPLYPAPHFSLTDQSGNTVSDQSLRGNVWVAMVFFTNCPDICPGMVGRLLDLQDAVPDSRVKLIPFTIDPERDTPEALKRYADAIKADPDRWHFLTGTKDQMFQAASGLKLAAEPATGDKPIIHSGKILLIDADGYICGVYDHKDNDDMTRLAADAKVLAERTAPQ